MWQRFRVDNAEDTGNFQRMCITIRDHMVMKMQELETNNRVSGKGANWKMILCILRKQYNNLIPPVALHSEPNTALFNKINKSLQKIHSVFWHAVVNNFPGIILSSRAKILLIMSSFRDACCQSVQEKSNCRIHQCILLGAFLKW